MDLKIYLAITIFDSVSSTSLYVYSQLMYAVIDIATKS